MPAKIKQEVKAEDQKKPIEIVKKEPKQKLNKEVNPVIIKEIIREVPRAKRPPSAFNTFMSDEMKNKKLTFVEAIAKWNENKKAK